MVRITFAAFSLALGGCTAGRSTNFTQVQGPSFSAPQRLPWACWAASPDGRNARVLNPEVLPKGITVSAEPPATFSAMIHCILPGLDWVASGSPLPHGSEAHLGPAMCRGRSGTCSESRTLGRTGG